MELVVDTNRVIAALIKDGLSRKIILSRKFSLYTVEFGIKEVQKYKTLIKRKAKVNEQEFNFLMKHLLSKVMVLSEEEISKKSVSNALKLMGKIDINDVPFIALSIELGNKAIWSDDNHFKQQKKIRAMTTKELGKQL
ncbi:MAG: PIN domain-containing protein [Candidatus Diapherotrites archaeon]|nr:PIN domain-containing protein [Candidatus Diapherotrites archaeon]